MLVWVDLANYFEGVDLSEAAVYCSMTPLEEVHVAEARDVVLYALVQIVAKVEIYHVGTD